jgi:hypothetical protein
VEAGMASSTVRISQETKTILETFAREDNLSFQEELGRLVERERRRRMIEATSAWYEELRANPEEWAAFQEEVGPWENTVGDGLEPW